MEFSREPFSVVEANFYLIEQHWEEVVRDNRKLEPYWDAYYNAENIGMLLCFIARQDGEVVGYAVFFLQPDLHSRHTMLASNNTVFLRRDCRRRGGGRAFIEYCDTELKKLGIVNRIAWHLTPQADFSKLLESLGYRHFSTIFVKDIEVQHV